MGKSDFHRHMFFKFQSSQTVSISTYRKVSRHKRALLGLIIDCRLMMYRSFRADISLVCRTSLMLPHENRKHNLHDLPYGTFAVLGLYYMW